MHDNPCHLRGLFGKGMTETHKVLHVAEKLIHHFLPKYVVYYVVYLLFYRVIKLTDNVFLLLIILINYFTD